MKRPGHSDSGDVEARVVGPGFHEQVYALVRQVPRGMVTTYGDVATILGSPRVARHVGWALSSLRAGPTDVPWHRVINAQGRVSSKGDFGRANEQEIRLAAEGIEVDAHGRIMLARFRWRGPADASTR
jgi:methylated-DNA-protein-cysteine methyltransferase-like protein